MNECIVRSWYSFEATLLIIFQVQRVKSVISEGVREIWLSSEDTGAYGTYDIFYFDEQYRLYKDC